MASAVCPSCGIKVRAGRDRCPRCRHLFDKPPSAQPAVAPQLKPPARARSKAFVPAVTAIALAIAALAGFAFWRAGEPATTFPIAVAPTAGSTEAVGSRAAAVATDRAPAPLTSEQFMEPAHGARVAFADGDYARAVSAYEEAVAKRPQDAESWSNLGQALVKLNRVAESIAKFEKAIELNPERWAYHFNLARAQGLLGKWNAAVSEYRAAGQLFPDDYATAFNLGLALRKAGDDAGAAAAFKHAIELDPQDPTFHFSLAGTYEKLGQVADAIAEYQRTLELAGPAPEAPAIQARISQLKGDSAQPAAPPAAPSAKEPAPGFESDR